MHKKIILVLSLVFFSSELNPCFSFFGCCRKQQTVDEGEERRSLAAAPTEGYGAVSEREVVGGVGSTAPVQHAGEGAPPPAGDIGDTVTTSVGSSEERRGLPAVGVIVDDRSLLPRADGGSGGDSIADSLYSMDTTGPISRTFVAGREVGHKFELDRLAMYLPDEDVEEKVQPSGDRVLTYGRFECVVSPNIDLTTHAIAMNMNRGRLKKDLKTYNRYWKVLRKDIAATFREDEMLKTCLVQTKNACLTEGIEFSGKRDQGGCRLLIRDSGNQAILLWLRPEGE